MENDSFIAEFRQYNGFYKNPNARRIIFEIFRGQCAATEKQVGFDEADIGHIVPQSEKDYFEQLFPGLDVHNILNLHLLSQNANRRVSNHFPKNPLAVYNAISYNMRLIRGRLPKIELGEKQSSTFHAQDFIDSTHVSLDVDFSDSYKNGKCFGTVHVVPTFRFNSTCCMALVNAGYDPQDYAFNAIDSLYESYLVWTIEQRKVTSVLGHLTKREGNFFANPDLEDLSERLFFLRSRGIVLPSEIENNDGDYVASSGPLASANRIAKIMFQRISIKPYLGFIQALAITQKWEKEGRLSQHGKLTFIRNSNLGTVLDSITNPNSLNGYLFSSIFKNVKIPKVGLFELGNFLKGDDDFEDENIPRIFTGTVVRTSDYKKFIKDFEKWVVKTVSKIEQSANVQTLTSQPMPL